MSSLTKNSILTLAICLLSCLASEAQDVSSHRLRHEVSFGCGYIPVMPLSDWPDEDERWQSPSLHLQYLYNINRRIGFGAMVDYIHSTWNSDDMNYLYKYKNKDKIFKDKESTNWVSFGLTARVYWFKKDYFAMYSRVGISYLSASGHDSGIYWVPTFSPVSMEWGGGNVRFCTEILSVGTFGMINGGIKYTF